MSFEFQRRARGPAAMLVAVAFACAPAPAFGQAPLPVGQRTNGRIAVEGVELANADGTNPTFPLTGSDPAWSPSGLQLAFTARGSNGGPQIFISDPDGKGRRQITNDPATASDPTWSPDGGSIAFTSTRDGNREIYVIGVDGQGERRLTDDPGIDQQPDWSPVGNTIVFESNRAGNSDLWLIDATGANLRQLTSNPVNEWDADWSPDATRIAYARVVPGRGQAIFSISPDASSPAQLTSGAAFDQFPAWSPDGALIAFTSSRSPFGIWLMPAAGDGGGAGAHPSISGGVDPDWGALPPPAPPAALGTTTANIVPVAGTVTVTPPEGRGAALLEGSARIPVGSLVQASDGTVSLLGNTKSATAPADQTATVSQGAFVLDPPTATAVTLHMASKRAAPCPRGPARAARLPPPEPRLKVHSRHGRYATITRDAKTISPGTTWLTIESCRGTLTRVTKGFVEVTSLRTGRVVRVAEGHELLVPRAAP